MSDFEAWYQEKLRELGLAVLEGGCVMKVRVCHHSLWRRILFNPSTITSTPIGRVLEKPTDRDGQVVGQFHVSVPMGEGHLWVLATAIEETFGIKPKVTFVSR
ncbi:MAG: hypothetical protein WC817_00125 [Patescibacteria group bacterium]|jgi:hypothetical protein